MNKVFLPLLSERGLVVAVTTAIFFFLSSCVPSSDSSSPLLLAECDVEFFAYEPNTNNLAAGKEVRLSYYRGGDELVDSPSLRLPRPKGDGKVYTTNQEGKFEAVVYKHSDSGLIIEVGGIKYQMLTTDLVPLTRIEETEEDRIANRGSEAPINFNLQVLKCQDLKDN